MSYMTVTFGDIDATFINYTLIQPDHINDFNHPLFQIKPSIRGYPEITLVAKGEGGLLKANFG